MGVPITALLNDASHRYGRAGYYVCAAVAAISAILMFFVGHPTNGRQNLSKYSTNGSITSHCTMPTSECPDLLNRSFSSGRYNNWYSQSTPYTTMSNGCASSAHHQHACTTPSHIPYMNGGFHTNHCQSSMANGGGAPGNGRLQKSLSFAFQNPAMWSDGYQQNHYSNNGGVQNYATYRPHSR